MDVRFSPEVEAEIARRAASAGKDPAVFVQEAISQMLAEHLEWERHDHRETVAGIRQGYEEMKAGQGRPAAEFLAEVRRKHDLPR